MIHLQPNGNVFARRLSFIVYCLFLFSVQGAYAQTIYVSPKGNDRWNGSERRPVATFAKAQELVRQKLPSDVPVEVIFEDGTYYLPSSVVFTPEDSRALSAAVTFRARHRGGAVLSGGKELFLKWKQLPDAVYEATVPAGLTIDQLYVDGKRQRMARFPNVSRDSGNNVFDTWRLGHRVSYDPSMDPLNKKRVAGWKNPVGAYLHAMHSALWGDMHWQVTGVAHRDSLLLAGGWQNNRPSPMHPVYRMVENVREELDEPGEWYHDRSDNKLYFIPEVGTNLSKAKIEVVLLDHLLEFNGTAESPVTGIHIQGFTFRHTNRKFMENREPLLRSDWTIYRGGAVVYSGAEDCTLTDCEFDQTGGNSIFLNNYNRHIAIERCYIHHSGANGIAFVGDPDAVRNPLFRYGRQNYAGLDSVSGPKNNNYPQECRVSDCLITMTGRDEKQTAPVQISMSYRITVSHCSIYDVPRAGININEGTFGGHLIEYCDVFNTVLETGDHGSFNSWGRDRYWTPDVNKFHAHVLRNPAMTWWDMLEPNTLRNSRWRCDHGWDIDLDDGSSHYRIYNNVLLNGGLKMREGYDRIAVNNVILNNSLHPHVWLPHSGDVFMHNIVCTAYQPAAMQSALTDTSKWGETLDYNLFACDDGQKLRYRKNGTDAHSLTGNPLFISPQSGDYRVAPSSPALRVGFRNFGMNDFGVRVPYLRKIAKTPEWPILSAVSASVSGDRPVRKWLGASVTVPQKDELSAYGVAFDRGGIAFYQVGTSSAAYRAGIRNGDLLQSINGRRISGYKDLEVYLAELDETAPVQHFSLIRRQETFHVDVPTGVVKSAVLSTDR